LAIEKLEIAFQETPNDPITIYGLASMLDRKGYSDRVVELVEPLKNRSNPKTREKCLPLLLKAYERKNEILKAAEVRVLLEKGRIPKSTSLPTAADGVPWPPRGPIRPSGRPI